MGVTPIGRSIGVVTIGYGSVCITSIGHGSIGRLCLCGDPCVSFNLYRNLKIKILLISFFFKFGLPFRSKCMENA